MQACTISLGPAVLPHVLLRIPSPPSLGPRCAIRPIQYNTYPPIVVGAPRISLLPNISPLFQQEVYAVSPAHTRQSTSTVFTTFRKLESNCVMRSRKAGYFRDSPKFELCAKLGSCCYNKVVLEHVYHCTLKITTVLLPGKVMGLQQYNGKTLIVYDACVWCEGGIECLGFGFGCRLKKVCFIVLYVCLFCCI